MTKHEPGEESQEGLQEEGPVGTENQGWKGGWEDAEKEGQSGVLGNLDS